MAGKLRWKKESAKTGLSAIGASARGYDYWDGEATYATIHPKGGGWRSVQTGWYWWAGVGPHTENTCNSPVETVEEAKAAASKWVKERLP